MVSSSVRSMTLLSPRVSDNGSALRAGVTTTVDSRVTARSGRVDSSGPGLPEVCARVWALASAAHAAAAARRRDCRFFILLDSSGRASPHVVYGLAATPRRRRCLQEQAGIGLARWLGIALTVAGAAQARPAQKGRSPCFPFNFPSAAQWLCEPCRGCALKAPILPAL